MEEKFNSDTEKTSIPYPEYIASLAAAINQYGRGEVTIYEWMACLELWWDENKEAWERDFDKGTDVLRMAYICTVSIGIDSELPQVIQHSEENDRKSRELLLQRHPDPQWWIAQNS